MKAERFYLRALEIREKVVGSEDLDVATSFNNLARVYQAIGGVDAETKAEQLYQRALAIREKLSGPEHPHVANSISSLAELYFSQGNYDKAEQFHQRAVSIFEKVFGVANQEVADSLNSLAHLYHTKGNIQQAITYQARANESREQDLERNLIAGSENEKLIYLSSTVRGVNRTLSLHIQSAFNNKEAAQSALAVVLRSKGRSLDAMTDAIAKLRQNSRPEDQQLFDKLISARSEYSTLALKGPGKGGIEKYKVKLGELARQIDKLEADISARNAEFRTQITRITLENIQCAIPASSTLIEFTVYQPYDVKSNKYVAPHYAAYLLNHNGDLRWIDLGETEPIDLAITEFRSTLIKQGNQPLSNIDKELKPTARALDKLLMQPVRKLIGDKQHLLISPDGALNLLPFETLVDETNKYLIENYEISYLTSGRDLLRLQNRIKNDRPPLIVANPDYGKGEGPILIGQQFPPLKPLANTAQEATQIKATLPDAVIHTQLSATEQTLKTINSPSILHIATHGYFLKNAEVEIAANDSRNLELGKANIDVEKLKLTNPLLRSCLFFAGANQSDKTNEKGNDDGVLTALEAAGLNLSGTKLVVLSACETGLGEVKNGDGVYGLRRALVLAGAETQMMSLWAVNDAVTKDLMVEYYKLLQSGVNRSKALRQVQLSYLTGQHSSKSSKSRHTRRLNSNDKGKSGVANYQHPYYWASFIQSGDWRELKK